AAALQTLGAYQRALQPRQRRVQWGFDQGAFPSDGVAGHISQPGVAEGPGGVQEPGRCPSGDFGFGYAGLGNMRANGRSDRI
ncbi:MAG TPA: hypothetical protein PLW35_06085, partial [Verrucomicrobiota bacterium]|nr:hypothetical protein [Verrucomicrobiota bacterium]